MSGVSGMRIRTLQITTLGRSFVEHERRVDDAARRQELHKRLRCVPPPVGRTESPVELPDDTTQIEVTADAS